MKRFLRSVAIGAAIGVFISIAMLWYYRVPVLPAKTGFWKSVAASAYAGAVFAAGFDLFLGVPLRYLGRRFRDVPEFPHRPVMVLTAFCGGTLAFIAIVAVLSATVGAKFHTPLPLWQIAVIDGFLAVGIVLFMASHQRLKAERDAAAAKAESIALSAQIRPHFLFNTLNTISAQVKTDPTAAQENIARLADMFRHTMHHARQERVSVREEIDLAREYLMLEAARFGERLQVRLPDEGTVADHLRLPGLTLQPIVENAVRHGIAKRAAGGCVAVGVRRNGKGWVLAVTNPCDVEVPDERLFREGHALSILRKRLPGLRVVRQTPEFEVEVPLGP